MKNLYSLIIFFLLILNMGKVSAQCINPTLLLNLPDTTIAFKQDSILLDAGAGFTTYSWSTGATTRFVWAKFSMKYKVTVTQGSSCGSDSTNVILLKGIEQKDQSLCLGTNLVLSVPANVPKNGLVAYYSFNGNTLDQSGNGYHINAKFNNYKTQDRFGKSDNSMKFTDINDTVAASVNFPTSLGNSFNNLNSGSVSMWVKINQHVLSNHYFGFDNMFMVKQKDGVNTQLYLGLLGGTRKIRFHLDGGLPTQNIFSSNTILDTGKWYNVTVTWNYSISGTIQNIFINGVLDATIISTNRLAQMTNPDCFILGVRAGVGSTSSKSNIDEVAFWSRSLSTDEVRNNYNNSLLNQILSWSTSDTTSSITVSPTTNTTYYCDIKVGSYTFRDSIRVTVRALPTKTVGYAKLGLCKNDTIALNAATGYTYKWFKNNALIGQSQVYKVSQEGAYRVTLADSFGCSVTSDTLRVFNAPLPHTNVLVKDTVQCLKGNNFLFRDSTLVDSGTYTRLWSFAGGNTSTQTTPSFTFASAGTYTVKLLVTTNYGCKDSIFKNINVNPSPTVGPMLGQTNALIVSTPYIYTVAQQVNHTYNWMVNNGIVAAGQGTNVATVQWLNNGKGYLKVEVTNVQGCADTNATQVTIGNVGIKEERIINRLFVYPNPSAGNLTISFNALKASTIQMSLVNLLGQQVWNENFVTTSGDQDIPIQTHLSPGIYTLYIRSHDEQIQHKLIIK